MKENFYEPCHLHQNQYLQIVCQSCQEASLACPMCIDQFHSGHQMISLKKFIASQIPKLYQKKPSLQKVNQGIQAMRQGFLNGFQIMRKRIGYEINEIQQIYNVEAQRLKKQIEVVCEKGSYNQQNITAIKHKINENLKIPNQQKLQNNFKNIVNQVSFLMSETTNLICKTIKELKQYWEISCGVILNSRQKIKHQFSDKNKHQLIDLKSKTAQKGNKNDGHKNQQKIIAINTTFDSKYHIVVVEPPLNPFKNQVQFKIQESIHNCVWIGVCDLQKVKQKNFQNCYKKNQGCYWIWQSGGQQECQFFSSLLEQSITLVIVILMKQNCIKVGDIISVRLDYCKQDRNRISFYKLNQDSTNQKRLIYSGQIEKKQLYACVALGDEFEKVSIDC